MSNGLLKLLPRPRNGAQWKLRFRRRGPRTLPRGSPVLGMQAPHFLEAADPRTVRWRPGTLNKKHQTTCRALAHTGHAYPTWWGGGERFYPGKPCFRGPGNAPALMPRAPSRILPRVFPGRFAGSWNLAPGSRIPVCTGKTRFHSCQGIPIWALFFSIGISTGNEGGVG